MKAKRSVISAFALGLVTAFLMSLMVVPGFAATVAKTIKVYTGITLYYNGTKVNPKDASGKTVEPFLYNGTTYLPVRAVSNLFGENINWDGNSHSVYIGDMPGKKTYLSDLTPYDKSDYYTDPFSMDGRYYGNGFTLTSGWGGKASWNLNGAYDVLKFDVGHVDHTDDDKVIYIYLDGHLSQTIKVNAGDLVKHVTVPLNGALRLKIETDSGGSLWAKLGFANTELS